MWHVVDARINDPKYTLHELKCLLNLSHTNLVHCTASNPQRVPKFLCAHLAEAIDAHQAAGERVHSKY